jgi:hypothetical protein
MFQKDNKRLRLQKEEESRGRLFSERKEKTPPAKRRRKEGEGFFIKPTKDSACRKKKKGRRRYVLERQQKTTSAERKRMEGKCFLKKDKKRLRLKKVKDMKGTRKYACCRKNKKGRERNVLTRQQKTADCRK